MPNISTGELIERVSNAAGLNRTQAKRVVDEIFSFIGARLEAGERLQIKGFGSFEVRPRAARTGTNPRTREKVQIPASKAVAFRPATALRTRIISADGQTREV